MAEADPRAVDRIRQEYALENSKRIAAEQEAAQLQRLAQNALARAARHAENSGVAWALLVNLGAED